MSTSPLIYQNSIIFVDDAGNVFNVKNFGASDLLETTVNNKIFYIPMNEDNLVSIDLDKKKIIVNPIKGIID